MDQAIIVTGGRSPVTLRKRVAVASPCPLQQKEGKRARTQEREPISAGTRLLMDTWCCAES